MICTNEKKKKEKPPKSKRSTPQLSALEHEILIPPHTVSALKERALQVDYCALLM